MSRAQDAHEGQQVRVERKSGEVVEGTLHAKSPAKQSGKVMLSVKTDDGTVRHLKVDKGQGV